MRRTLDFRFSAGLGALAMGILDFGISKICKNRNIEMLWKSGLHPGRAKVSVSELCA